MYDAGWKTSHHGTVVKLPLWRIWICTYLVPRPQYFALVIHFRSRGLERKVVGITEINGHKGLGESHAGTRQKNLDHIEGWKGLLPHCLPFLTCSSSMTNWPYIFLVIQGCCCVNYTIMLIHFFLPVFIFWSSMVFVQRIKVSTSTATT